MTQVADPRVALLDADDRRVLASAIRFGAKYLVTDTLADFLAEVLRRFQVEAVDADGFLSRTFDLYPPDALGVLRTLQQPCSSLPFARSEFVRDAAAKWLPRLASRT